MSSSLVLPEVSGVMLLPDCTLFPHGGLPLHVFEPRYKEMLREVNTLGSKSPDTDVAHRVVEMKSSIDKLKEQAANLA